MLLLVVVVVVVIIIINGKVGKIGQKKHTESNLKKCFIYLSVLLLFIVCVTVYIVYL